MGLCCHMTQSWAMSALLNAIAWRNMPQLTRAFIWLVLYHSIWYWLSAVSTWIYDTCLILPSAPAKCIIPKRTTLCLCYSIFVEDLPTSFLSLRSISNTVSSMKLFLTTQLDVTAPFLSLGNTLWFSYGLYPALHWISHAYPWLLTISQGGVLMTLVPHSTRLSEGGVLLLT